MFMIGQRVRIRLDAFHGLDDQKMMALRGLAVFHNLEDERSMAVRGRVGLLAGLLDEDEDIGFRVWLWRSDDSEEAAVFDKDIEPA